MTIELNEISTFGFYITTHINVTFTERENISEKLGNSVVVKVYTLKKQFSRFGQFYKYIFTN